MNRLYGLIAAVAVCFVLFITLARAGRKSEAGTSYSRKKATAGSKLKPREGGNEIRLGVDTEPATLDPISIVDTISDGIANKLFNKLVRMQLQPNKELKIVPDLAEALPEISKDNLTYIFKLRHGIRFHNGREVKAADFVYSLKRLMSPISKRSELLQPFVKGGEEYVKNIKGDEVTHDDPNLGITAPDDYTLKIELIKPFAPFLMHLTTISCAVVPREVAERKDPPFARAPMGTGPFKLDPNDWASNQQLLLNRFDDYFGGKPKLDAVRFMIYKDRILQLKLFMAGQLDGCSIPNGHVRSATADVGPENWFETMNMRTNYIGFGMACQQYKNKKELAPFGIPENKLIRQAMSYALDREYLCDTVLEGRGKPAIGVLPPGMPGCKEDRPPLQKDLEKARALLAQAGYPGGKGLPRITMLYRNDPDVKNIAQAMAHDFDQIGVRIDLEAQEWNRFLETVEKEPVPLFVLGWVADYPDPDNFLYVLFNTKQFGSPGNQVFYSNPEVDRLTEEARTLMDMKDRARIYEKAENIILEDMPWICTYHVRNVALLRKEFTNIRERMSPLDTGTEFPQVDFKDVGIDSTGLGEKRPPLDTKLGENVELTGVAENSKSGPQLVGIDFTVYVAGMQSWPEGFQKKAVSIAGKLEERHDLPVFVQKEGEPRAGGIPVKEGTDLKAASRRLVVNLTKMELVQ